MLFPFAATDSGWALALICFLYGGRAGVGPESKARAELAALRCSVHMLVREALCRGVLQVTINMADQRSKEA